jgi:hypothetical protein
MRSVQNCTEFISSINILRRDVASCYCMSRCAEGGGNDYKDPGKGKHFLLCNISNRLAEINITKKDDKFKF